MSPADRLLFIVGVALHLVAFGLACLAALAFVTWQWFAADRIMAVFVAICAGIVLPIMAPDPDTLQTWRHLLKNPNEK